MLVCDKCGNKLSFEEKKDASQTMTVYQTQGAYIGHSFDLCKNCKRLLEVYKSKMESYFMISDNPTAIFDNEQYWDGKRKYH